MTALKPILKTLLILLWFIPVALQGQDCQDAETFDDFTVNTVLPPAMNPGYFNGYGSPLVIDDNCPTSTTGQGVRIKGSVDGSAGDAVGYTMTGGISGGEQFVEGVDYVFSGSKLLINGDLVNTYQNATMHIRLTNDLNIGNTCPTGDCELVISKSISEITNSACAEWGDTQFTPGANYDHMLISVTAPIFLSLFLVCKQQF